MVCDGQPAYPEASHPFASQQAAAAPTSQEQSQEQSIEQHLLALQQENEQLRAELQQQKKSETALSKRIEYLQQIIDVLPVCISYCNCDRQYEFVSKRYEEWLDCPREEILGRHVRDVIGREAYAVVKDKIDRVLLGEQLTYEVAIPYQNGLRYVNATLIPSFNDHSQVKGWYALLTDISDRRRAEEQLEQQAQREHALNLVIQTIRNSLDLDTIFATAVQEIGKLIQVDRVAITQYSTNQNAWHIVAEYVCHASGVSGIDLRILDEANPLARQLKRQKIVQINSVTLSDQTNRQITEAFPGAWLFVPVHSQSGCWGCITLVKQHHHWRSTEIALARTVADQLAIAIHQSELYQQVQQLNADLEQQVLVRTFELQTALDFEALLKRITDKVRESLDERQILQTVVHELGTQLDVACCDTGLYDLEQGISTICYEYVDEGVEPGVGKVDVMAKRSDLYDQLRQGKLVQFCENLPEAEIIRPTTHHATILACPFVDESSILGDMWLFKFAPECYGEMEIRLIQQVANQCTIALRQARLYQATQKQVEELERLHRLKDDFLSTVSHELRTPLSNIKMAIELLDINLFQTGGKRATQMAASGLHASATHTWETPVTLQPTVLKHLAHYLQILHDECHRETDLINDLLDLTRLDAEVDPLILTPVQLQLWIPHVIEPFLDGIHRHQQQVDFNIPADLPPLHTDAVYLERILSELFHNACKYTPVGGQIQVSVWAEGSGCNDSSAKTFRERRARGGARELEVEQGLSRSVSTQVPHVQTLSNSAFLICLRNTGTHIPPDECDRMFDKFYRIPNNDPWKHGGTGLGLALVKKRVERLGGEIWAESPGEEVVFNLRLTEPPE
jgi:PAS domain S-box-containing protein